MTTINKINVFANETETIAIFDSAVTRYLTDHGYNVSEQIVKICGLLPENYQGDAELDKAIEAAETRLYNYVYRGYTNDNGTYVPMFAGSSDIRKGTFVSVNKQIIKELGTWMICGLNLAETKIAINKYMSYMGLLMSSSRPFVEVFGKKIDVHKVCVIDDSYVTVEGVADLVTPTVRTENVRREFRINAFDGAAIIRKDLTNGQACTIRAPWTKALAIPCDIKKFADRRGVSTIVKDFWGNPVDLAEMDLILTASTFKMAKNYKSFADYQKAFVALGHEYAVCVEEHKPKAADMPYQQFQTLVGADDEDIESFVDMAKESLGKYSEATEAGKLLGGYAAKVAQMLPGILKDSWAAGNVAKAYEARVNKVYGGKLPGCGSIHFIAPDPVAFMEAALGLPVVGSLKAGECACRTLSFGKVDITRNPHLDHAHVMLNNVKLVEGGMGPTMYINIWDLTTIRLRCDYDGDHVFATQNAKILSVVEKTNQAIHNLPVDWDAPESTKGKVTKELVNKFCFGLTKASQIGIYADTMTKMWAHGYDVCANDYLTFAGNVLIDAAKHGTANIVDPTFVRDLKKAKLPMFAMYAKADNEDRPLNGKYWTDKVEETNGVVDQYSRICRTEIGTQLKINGYDSLKFDWEKLLVPGIGIKVMEGLHRNPVYDVKNKTYINRGGLFEQIMLRHADEWVGLKKDKDARIKKMSWDQIRGKAGFEEIKAFAEANGRTIEEAYNHIVRKVWSGEHPYKSAIENDRAKEAFFRIFGEMAVRVLRNNIEQEMEDLMDANISIDEFEDECDVFECED